MDYKIKRISFNNNVCPILLQAVNGPCPLIAACNVLFLRNKLKLHPQQSSISFQELCMLLTGYLQTEIAKASQRNINEAKLANQLQNFEDAMAVLPTLEKGLDVNVKFNSCLAFEFTKELTVFDLCDIRLVHGWVYDPQDKQLANALKDYSYNKIVNILLADAEDVKLPSKHADDTEAKQGTPAADEDTSVAVDGREIDAVAADEVSIAEEEVKEQPVSALETKTLPVSESSTERLLTNEVLRKWLMDTAAQLTVAGLAQMHEKIKEGELCVHFRNNHFAVVLKKRGYLFTLVTDQGIISADPRIVWCRIGDIDGDDFFLTDEFRTPAANPPQARRPPPQSGGTQVAMPGQSYPSPAIQGGLQAPPHNVMNSRPPVNNLNTAPFVDQKTLQAQQQAYRQLQQQHYEQQIIAQNSHRTSRPPAHNPTVRQQPRGGQSRRRSRKRKGKKKEDCIIL